MMISVAPVAARRSKRRSHDRGAGGGVEVAGRFVAEDERRTRAERAGDRHALLLATGQLRGVMADPVREADRGEFDFRALERVGHPGQFHRHGDVLECGHRREQVEGLKDDPDPPTPRAR